MICWILFLFTLSEKIDFQMEQDTIILQKKPEVWNYLTNYGVLGGEKGMALPGLSWPGNISVNNYYSWESYFVVGVKENGFYYVTQKGYQTTEWGRGKIFYHGPGISEEDIVISWHDSSNNIYNAPTKRTGLEVICRSYTWSFEPWNDFIPYEFFVIWHKDQCDIPNVGETLDSVFIGIYMDCDISGADWSNPQIDDTTFFDGYVAHEWDTLGYPYDSVTLLPDTFLNIPDSIYDQYIIYGDNEWEHTIRGDTLLLPRNLAYMWDYDDPTTPGNDIGENGASAGYAGIALLYAPPSIADSIWINGYGDTCRAPRVWAYHGWVSGGIYDDTIYFYLSGKPYRFICKSHDPYIKDFRYLISSGPFKMADGETLKFVFVLAIGQGMNGGDDQYYGRGWIRGLRQTIDYALAGYYTGSEISDPSHPSGPNEDIHWKILPVSEKNNKKKFYLNLPTILNSSCNLKIKGSPEVEIFNITGRKINENMLFKGFKEGIYFLKPYKEKFKKVIILY